MATRADPHFYGIWQGNGWMDGEAYPTKEACLRALHCAGLDDTACMFLPASSSMEDVTEDMVIEAYDAGLIDREHPLVQHYVSLPETYDEHMGDRADAAWHSAA